MGFFFSGNQQQRALPKKVPGARKVQKPKENLLLAEGNHRKKAGSPLNAKLGNQNEHCHHSFFGCKKIGQKLSLKILSYHWVN